MALVILVLKTLVRLIGFLLALALCIIGLALAVFSIQGGKSGLSITHLAHLVHLPALRHDVDTFLTRMEASGPIAVVALASGVGAVIIGVLALVGVLVPTRERLLTLSSSGDEALLARRRALAALARSLAERADGVSEAKVRVRVRRRGGGKLTVRAQHTRATDATAARSALEAALAPLIGPLSLSAKLKVRPPEQGAGVE
ncbi:MAG: DUF6286 domain-containing protein [Actinomycetota bacterium]|nr:DUF6286 domain-containing protein [Actinomycetota bacterium]